MRCLIVLMLIFLIHPLSGVDFGKHGHSFPIQEESLLKVLLQKMQALPKEELESILNSLKEKTIFSLKHPKPVPEIFEAQRDDSFTIDPTIEVVKNIEDARGKVIIPKGTKVNPLDYQTLNTPILFFDGKDRKQIDWAKRQGHTNWVLLAGDPLKLEKEENRPVYFDQNGYFCKKLAIESIPAKVFQEGKLLRVQEFTLE